ncbi:hypothetical protein CRENBAI_013490 [Crenichthys baileyi]|uniref:Uncharacterized protein n=1 Tax=Crenichthys baileyi TaxID=28760 RepID=A0AAV9SBN1_9TELE
MSKVFSYRGRHAAEVWVFEGHLQNLSFAAIGQVEKELECAFVVRRQCLERKLLKFVVLERQLVDRKEQSSPGYGGLYASEYDCVRFSVGTQAFQNYVRTPWYPPSWGWSPKSEVNESQRYTCRESERENLRRFVHEARSAIRDKFSQSGADMPDFLQRAQGRKGQTRPHLLETDTRNSYGIPKDARPKKGVPSTLQESQVRTDPVPSRKPSCRAEGSNWNTKTAAQCTVTLPKRRTCLTHNVDPNNLDLRTTSVKARGLVAFKSVRSLCASALTETFVACVMRGDCVTMENDCVP